MVNAETEGIRLEGILLLHDHVSQRIPQSMVLCLKLERRGCVTCAR